MFLMYGSQEREGGSKCFFLVHNFSMVKCFSTQETENVHLYYLIILLLIFR